MMKYPPTFVPDVDRTKTLLMIKMVNGSHVSNVQLMMTVLIARNVTLLNILELVRKCLGIPERTQIPRMKRKENINTVILKDVTLLIDNTVPNVLLNTRTTIRIMKTNVLNVPLVTSFSTKNYRTTTVMIVTKSSNTKTLSQDTVKSKKTPDYTQLNVMDLMTRIK